MGARLASYVHVAGRVFGPADDVPPDVAALITNPAAWEGGQVPAASPAPAVHAPEVPQPVKPASSPPPKAGPGSAAPAWREYAAKVGVDVADDADKATVIEALTAAGKPVDRPEK